MKKLFLLTIFLFLISCNTENNEEVHKESAKHLDVSYGSHNLQKMDIYLPEGRGKEKTKVLVLIHGGG